MEQTETTIGALADEHPFPTGNLKWLLRAVPGHRKAIAYYDDEHRLISVAIVSDYGDWQPFEVTDGRSMAIPFDPGEGL